MQQFKYQLIPTEMKFLAIFVCILLSATLYSEAQDRIFRKNGEVIEAFNLTESGKSRSYRLANDGPEIKRYISTAVVDSIMYENGKKDVFSTLELGSFTVITHDNEFKRNLISLDLAHILFFQSLKFSYEYLPGKGFTGLFISVAANLNPSSLYQHQDNYGFTTSYKIYDSMGRLLNWACRIGFNQYIFPPGRYRLAGGLFWITGNYDVYLSRDLNEEPYYEAYHLKNQPLNGIVFSPMFCAEVFPALQLRGGLDIPLYTNAKMGRTFIRFDAGIAF